MLRPSTISAVLIGLHSAVAAAQTIACPQAPAAKADEPCVMMMRGDIEPIVVRIELNDASVAGAKVSFKPSRGMRGTIAQQSSVTDATGLAQTMWRGSADPGLAPDTIRVEATDGKWVTVRSLILKAPAKSAELSLAIDRDGKFSGDSQYWYAGRQLRRPLTVTIVGPKTESDCRASVVAFKAAGDAAATPDSARGRWNDTRCVAETHWKLGPTVGDQYLRASVGTDAAKQAIFHASARNIPWIAAGLTWTYVSGYNRLATTTQDLEVVSKSATAETTFKTTRSTKSVDVSSATGVFAPTLGVNTPLFTSWPRVRMSLAADVQHVTTDWFAGFSLPQLWDNIFNEDIAIDLQLVTHVSRREILLNPTECAADQKMCRIDKKARPVGVGLAVQVNGGALLTTIMNFFPK